MDSLIPLLIQLIGGGAGGNIVAGMLKKLDLNKIIATITGILGGVGGTQLAELLPMLQSVLGSDGGLGGVLANGGTSAAGGAILTLIVGFIKKAMAGR